MDISFGRPAGQVTATIFPMSKECQRIYLKAVQVRSAAEKLYSKGLDLSTGCEKQSFIVRWLRDYKLFNYYFQNKGRTLCNQAKVMMDESDGLLLEFNQKYLKEIK